MSGGTPLGTALAQVQVEHIDAPNGTPEARIAVELQNALDFELNGGGGLISPTHRLKVRMTIGRNSIITDVTTGRVAGGNHRHRCDVHADRAGDRQGRA